MKTPKIIQQVCDFLRLRKQRQGVKLSCIRAQPPHKNGEGRKTMRQKHCRYGRAHSRNHARVSVSISVRWGGRKTARPFFCCFYK